MRDTSVRVPIGYTGVLQPLVTVYFQGGPNPPPQTDLTEFLNGVGEIGNTALVLLLFAFPTGRFETRGARIGAAITLVPTVVWTPLEALHLLGVTGPAPEVPLSAVFTGFAALVLLGIGGQVVRYRRRPRIEQLQIKWFLLGIGVWLAYPLAFALGLDASGVWGIVISAPLPLAILAAITRYRLYDIDRIVSRTVAYATVVGLLALLGVGGVALLTSLLPTQDRLAVVLTTLAVVALFAPLRRRVVDAVDRRFDRTRYVARQVVEDFGRQVQDVTDLDEVVERVHAVTGATLTPATVAVWQPTEARP